VECGLAVAVNQVTGPRWPGHHARVNVESFVRDGFVAVRQAVDAKKPFTALLKDVRSAVLDARENQAFTFLRLLREVPSARVGELVMRELKRLDKVAYVRFASVYRSFEDVDEFRQLLRDI